jgi:hypothetical protein
MMSWDSQSRIVDMAVFDGIDIEKVKGELTTYVNRTTPRNGSGDGFITTTNYAACGRNTAIELTERVRPILDSLYPDWRDDNEEDGHFEFAVPRDASVRLLARIASHEEIGEMLAGHDTSPALTGNQLHPLVWGAASAQWATGHRHEAVLAASKAVNSMLQSKLGRRDVSEVNLAQESFGAADPKLDRPRLRFPMIEDDKTRESLTQGALSFGVGCFQAIRNPVGHLPNDKNELTDQEALERLAAWSLLARWIEQAKLEVAP